MKNIQCSKNPILQHYCSDINFKSSSSIKSCFIFLFSSLQQMVHFFFHVHFSQIDINEKIFIIVSTSTQCQKTLFKKYIQKSPHDSVQIHILPHRGSINIQSRRKIGLMYHWTNAPTASLLKSRLGHNPKHTS